MHNAHKGSRNSRLSKPTQSEGERNRYGSFHWLESRFLLCLFSKFDTPCCLKPETKMKLPLLFHYNTSLSCSVAGPASGGPVI